MNTLTPPPRKWSSRLGIGGLVALFAAMALMLCLLLSPSTAHATETTVKVSDAQTELFDTSIYLTDTREASPVIERIPDGWTTGTKSGNQCVYYLAEDYVGWTSGDATIVLRYDKIAKVNGEWVSVRLKIDNLKGNGVSPFSQAFTLPNGKQGSGIEIANDFWYGITYFGLYQVDCQIELLYTDTGETIDLRGGYAGFGSLNYSAGLGEEGIRYLTDNNYSSCILNSTNLTHEKDGTWRGASEEGWKDGVGTFSYNKNSVAFRIADEKPTFRASTKGTMKAAWLLITLTPLTIATPAAPVKNVELAGQ